MVVPYKLSAKCPHEELLGRLGQALCDLYSLIAESSGSNGPIDMTPIDERLNILGFTIEKHLPISPLVDTTPAGQA